MRPTLAVLPAVRRSARWLRWYLKEVSGESAYDRYLAHARAEHPDAMLSRREFERRRMDQRDERPESRCC
jgi:uncharacterized short protein YbdD (DUF466 family)